MKSTANTSAAGRFCGTPARGLSKLTRDDLDDIEASLTGERPASFAYLAAFYAVSELDIRAMFSGERKPPASAPKEPAPLSRAEHLARRDERFRTMWLQGVPNAEIMAALGIGRSNINNIRDRLELPKRSPGRHKDWRAFA